MPEFLNTAQGCFPSAAANVTATGSGAGAYGSWVELAASAPSDLAVSGVTTGVFSGFIDAGYVVVNIGSGAAGSEVSLAEFAGYVATFVGFTLGNEGCIIPALIPCKTITSGTRIAGRVKRGDGAQNLAFAVSYVGLPLSGNLETTTADLSHSAMVNVTSSGTAWNNGSYAEIEASTAAAWVLNHMMLVGGTTGEFELGIATGAAGSESEVMAWPTYGGSANFEIPHTNRVGVLFDNIGSGVRVAVRLRDSQTSNTRSTILSYYPKPL